MVVEAMVATRFGFGDAVAAGAPVHSVNTRFGFTSLGGHFPDHFRLDDLEVAQQLAYARELPGAPIMPRTRP